MTFPITKIFKINIKNALTAGQAAAVERRRSPSVSP